MTINPLIPFIPAFISFFLYGWIASGIFSFGRRGGHGCLFTIFFWYAFLVFAIFLWLFVSVQSTFNQLSFLVGASVPYIRRAWESEAVQAPIAIASDITHFVRRTFQKIVEMLEVWQAKKHQQHTEATSQQAEQHQAHTNHDEAMRQEQARREAEARERREQAERERQRQQESTDARSPEEVLGLLPHWTQDDLRTAYKREAGRTHPDKWIGKPESIRQAMEEEYKRIQEAYRRLKSE